MNFSCYDFISNLKVSKDMVDSNKQKILLRLKEKNYIHLNEGFGNLSNYRFACNDSTEDEELKKLINKISEFMAYQEAICDLVLNGILMPVRITNVSTYGGFNVRINYSKKSGMSTTHSNFDINIPILESHTFMLRPSIRNKFKQ